jgi:hypothetical protein
MVSFMPLLTIEHASQTTYSAVPHVRSEGGTPGQEVEPFKGERG